jgi:ATP phosphoribosyltransferase
VHRGKLDRATKITPGKRAPTINSLEEEGWVAVQCMVEKKKIAETMDELESVGAQDILVTKLENTRTTA